MAKRRHYGGLFQNGTFEVTRKNRIDVYGVMLIAVKRSLNSQSVEVKSENEQVWVIIIRKRKCIIIIGPLYRPPKSDLDCMENMRKSAESMFKKYKNSIILIGGGLNLPNIEWPSCSTTGSQNLK